MNAAISYFLETAFGTSIFIFTITLLGTGLTVRLQFAWTSAMHAYDRLCVPLKDTIVRLIDAADNIKKSGDLLAQLTAEIVTYSLAFSYSRNRDAYMRDVFGPVGVADQNTILSHLHDAENEERFDQLVQNWNTSFYLDRSIFSSVCNSISETERIKDSVSILLASNLRQKHRVGAWTYNYEALRFFSKSVNDSRFLASEGHSTRYLNRFNRSNLFMRVLDVLVDQLGGSYAQRLDKTRSDALKLVLFACQVKLRLYDRHNQIYFDC